MFFIWNRFKLIFRTSWKLQKWLVCVCICIQKNPFSQTAENYARVEAQALRKKNTEGVRHYALKFQQLIEKGSFNEHAANVNLKCNEIFTQVLAKKV